MNLDSILGASIVVVGGIVSGSGAWPMKLMKRYQFEHWWFVAMLTGLIVVPWGVTLTICPNVLKAFGSMPWRTLVTANLWATGWGVANVLCGICFVRLGLALTTAIITGLGAGFGATLPMIVKGSGLFSNSSDVMSPAGLAILSGLGVLLLAVVLASMAGAGRERMQRNSDVCPRAFQVTLLVAVLAGILSCGMALSFVYGQGPIMEAMQREGAGEISASFAVWAVGLMGGAVVSLLYPVWLMSRNKSWDVLGESWKELLLSVVIGVNLSISVVLMGLGMRMLGALGASVGIGIQAAAWMLGGQGVGLVSGEWRGVSGRPRRQMNLAIACLIVAVLILIHGNILGTR